MAITYENVIPTLIENTTMQMRRSDGVATNYTITPVSGFVLHDKGRDWPDEDPETGEETIKLGFTRGTATCGANYDFTANPREFYAVPENEVPADQIFGGGNDHEVM
jgi:hypothetical protein